MFSGFKMLAGAVALFGAMLSAAPAQAQDWSFGGITFTPRAGWCPSHTTQGGAQTLETRPCGQDYPYMSIAIGAPADGSSWDIPGLAETFAQTMEGPKGASLFAEAVAPMYGSCVKQSLTVERNPVPQVKGASVVATFDCTKNGVTTSIDFRNFTGYVQTKAGALWVVTFDYPQGPMTSDDHAMIKAAIDKIAAS